MWDRLHTLGLFERKDDSTMIEHYLAFVVMCKKVAGMELSEEDII